MIGFLKFLAEELLLESGKETSFRGQMNEIAIAHAIDRYLDLAKKHGGDHDKSIKELANEDHVGTFPNSKFKENVETANRELGKDETDRTLWDSHHAAVSLIDHIHKKEGGIAGPAIWSGPDVKGGTAEKIGGINTQADILIPTKKGDDILINHTSLKYSKEPKDSSTKLFQGTARQAVERIQKHHKNQFGVHHEGLNNALNNLEGAFGDLGTRLVDKHEEALNAAGFKKKKDGSYPVTNITKLARYASEIKEKSEKSKPTEADRKKIISNGQALTKHFDEAGIPPEERAGHVANLAHINNTTIKGDKTEAAQNFASQITDALDRSFTEGSRGQHDLVRDLLNIHERRKAKVLVMKTLRNKNQNFRENPADSLPITKFTVHSNDLEALYRKAQRSGLREHQMYRQVTNKNKPTASSTISTLLGKMASTSIDTSKTSPSLIIQSAGNWEKFKDISQHHPMHPDYKSSPSETRVPAIQQRSNDEETDHTHGGKSFYAPGEK